MYDIPFESRSSSIPPHDQKHSDFYGVHGHSKIRKNGKQVQLMSPAVEDYELPMAETDIVFDGQTSYGSDSHQDVSGVKNLNVDVLKKDRKRKVLLPLSRILHLKFY